MPNRTLLRDLAGQVDTNHVYARPADLAAYAYDSFGASGDRYLPDAIVFPATTAEVAGTVGVCAHHDVPVVPRGAGTGTSGGSVAKHGGVIVCLTRLNRVVGLERNARRIHVEAGTVISAINERAAAVRLCYPPGGAKPSTSTIGGSIARNVGGKLSFGHGTTTDYVQGLTVVMGDGRVRVIGEGHDHGDDDDDPGLLRLLCGSEGTLAIITAALLRLIPAPAARVTLAAWFADLEHAGRAAKEIAGAGIAPSGLEFMDAGALEAVSRTGRGAGPSNARALIVADIEGEQPETMTAATERTRNAVARAGAIRVEVAADAVGAEALWGIRQAIHGGVAKIKIGKLDQDVVVPPERLVALVGDVQLSAQRHGLAVANAAHLGDGRLTVSFLFDPRVEGERGRADNAVAELFDMVLGVGGSLIGDEGIGYARLGHVEQQLGSGAVTVMRSVKSSLDPQGILNPGKRIPIGSPTGR